MHLDSREIPGWEPMDPAASVAPSSNRSMAAVLTRQQLELAEEVRATDSVIDQIDVESAVDAGVLAGGRAVTKGTDDMSVSDQASATSMAVADASGQIGAQHSSAPVDYTQLGGVIPVLPGSPGAGASTVAAVLADALQMLSWRVLLADTADVARSGLASAAGVEGPVESGPHDAVGIRFSWRGQALVARAETSLPVLSPGMVPPPPLWVPPMGSPHVTVVDLSYDAWRMAAQPLSGPGAWLRVGQPPPRPILVVRPSRPSLARAEQALARLETWTAAGVAVSPVALVVVGAKRWPDGVVGAAGRRVSALLDRAIFLPRVQQTAVGGIGPDIAPLRLREAITPLLRAWHLAPEQPGRTKAARLFGKGGPR